MPPDKSIVHVIDDDEAVRQALAFQRAGAVSNLSGRRCTDLSHIKAGLSILPLVATPMRPSAAADAKQSNEKSGQSVEPGGCRHRR